MEDPRTEHARLEAEGWAAFEDALSRVPDDRLTAPGVLEGWTVKEMLHHVTGWIRDAPGISTACGTGRSSTPTTPTSG